MHGLIVYGEGNILRNTLGNVRETQCHPRVSFFSSPRPLFAVPFWYHKEGVGISVVVFGARACCCGRCLYLHFDKLIIASVFCQLNRILNKRSLKVIRRTIPPCGNRRAGSALRLVKVRPGPLPQVQGLQVPSVRPRQGGAG